jgi:hypothetical protein
VRSKDMYDVCMLYFRGHPCMHVFPSLLWPLGYLLNKQCNKPLNNY